MVRRATPPKLPKGYEPTYTSYELVTKTTYSKPYKEMKAPKGRAKVSKSKEYVQPVRVVNPTALKGKGKRGR